LSVLAGQSALAVAKESKGLAPAVAETARERVPGACAFLAVNPVQGNLANALFSSGLWQSAKTTEQHLPIQGVKDQLLSKVEQNLATNILTSTLNKFKQELEANRGHPDKAAEFASKQSQQFGWKHGASKTLRNKYEIAKDPDLAALREGFYAGSGLGDDPSG